MSRRGKLITMNPRTDPAQIIIRQLVSEVIESGRTVEEVCIERPDLITDVRRLLQRARAVEDQMDVLFPSSGIMDESATATPLDMSLPQIPGYELHSILGAGGMGVVYKARHISLNRTVAIKVPLAGAFATPSERQRHIREAQAIAAMGHPNIITVHDVGEFDGRPYFTMEFIDGQNLSAKLSNTPQPAREAAAMVAILADAADQAHQVGIIHRDLKPANILLAPDGTPKITDFGLARHSGRDAALTVGGFQFGTPSYMSPEQARGLPAASSRSVDIYSLGAILYEMLTGRPPFRAENAVETIRQVLEEEPVAPSRLNPKAPRDLETICLKCLHKDPERRYPSAAALSQDLRRFLRGEGIEARPVGPAERLYRWARRRPAHATLVGASVCAIVAAVAVAFWVQKVQSDRAAEATLRQGRARQAIETAVSLAGDLRANERWVEARHVLDDARSYLDEAQSHDLAEMLQRADQHLTAAWELDDIRRQYPESNESGFDYRPAATAYQQVFDRLGFGADVPLQAAARAVDSSPIRKELLNALDNAAFVARAFNHRAGMDRPLAIARAADPDPWRDRFRRPAAWFERDTLLALCDEARASTEPQPSHLIVIAGVLLGGLGANDKALEILHDAHSRNPLDFWVNLELGNLLWRANRSADASQYFRAAVTIQPKNPGAWVSLGANLNHSGSREEAIIAVRRAIELNPRLLPAWRNYITYLRAAGRIDEAAAALNRAAKELPAQAVSLDGLRAGLSWDRARRLASSNKWPEAMSEYRSALSNAPNDAEFWFEVGAVGLLAGEREDFEHARGTMLEWAGPGTLRPFLVARAATLTPAPADLVEAAAALNKSESPREASTYWSFRQRGATLCRTGRQANAVALFEKSIILEPSTSRAVLNWLWLAIAHHDLGHAEDSARWRAKAVAWLDAFTSGMPDNAPAIGLHLHDWLEAQVLRREIDSLRSGGKRE